LILSFVCLTVSTTPAPAADPDLAASVLAGAKQATGGQGWDHLTAWTETGIVHAGGLDGSYQTWSDAKHLRSAGQFDLGPASQSQGFDGTSAWSTDSSHQVRVEASQEAVAGATQDSYRASWGFFFPERFPAQTAYAGRRPADGAVFDVVTVTPKGADPFEVWVDTKTHRIDREVQLTGGQPATFLFSDWRRRGPVELPAKVIQRIAGDPKYDAVTLTRSVDMTTPVPDSRFAPPPPPADDSRWPDGVQSVTTPFRLINNHIYVPASLNGQPPVPFIFDTGATSVLDDDHAQSYGIAVKGALPGGGFGSDVTAMGLAKVSSVSIAGLTLPDQVFATSASSGWIAVEGTDSAGLLGYEFVKRAVLSIDYANRTMTFTKPSAFQPPVGVPAIPFTFEQHVPMVAGSVDGIPGEFEIDTGSRGSLTLMKPFADAHQLVQKLGASTLATTGYGMGGPSKSLLARAAAMTIGPVEIKHPVINVVMDSAGAAAATHTAGNIGGDILKRFTLTLDYGHQTLWLQPNGLADQPEIFDRSGLWVGRDKEGGIVIRDVTPGSAAAKAGLAIDDVITAVDGHAAGTIELSDLRESFKQAAGTSISLTIRRPAGSKTITLVLADQV
jgi:hypothetical protein